MALSNFPQIHFRNNINLDISYYHSPLLSSLTLKRSQSIVSSKNCLTILKLTNNFDESRLNSNSSCRPSSIVRSAISEKTSGATGDWVDLYLPENVRSYARLARVEKPIGSWLLAWPFAWSLALAADQGSFPDMKMLSIFSLWAVAIRGAACTINDYFDRDIDNKVERTRNRPMACGDVTPNEGLLFFFIQVLFGLGPLLSTNTISGILGLLHVPSVDDGNLFNKYSH
ncbi:acyltransferase [Lithospermum erythrorhizon]|uniref:Acyltransferase n=1 Tax=Lithospermum erythrorhizon TaxID=34254 RepID=A0AAV3QBP2_LITER